jgi:hypothetical protein
VLGGDYRLAAGKCLQYRHGKRFVGGGENIGVGINVGGYLVPAVKGSSEENLFFNAELPYQLFQCRLVAVIRPGDYELGLAKVRQ